MNAGYFLRNVAPCSGGQGPLALEPATLLHLCGPPYSSLVGVSAALRGACFRVYNAFRLQGLSLGLGLFRAYACRLRPGWG